MMQVLGADGNSPVEFLVCWTPKGDWMSSEVGGTGYALRCALTNNIPIFNLGYEDQKVFFENHLRSILNNLR
jgi:hypothetical protein